MKIVSSMPVMPVNITRSVSVTVRFSVRNRCPAESCSQVKPRPSVCMQIYSGGPALPRRYLGSVTDRSCVSFAPGVAARYRRRTSIRGQASMSVTAIQPQIAKPDVPELLARARTIAELARERTQQTEADCRVSEDMVARMRQADLLRVMQPRAYGGY